MGVANKPGMKKFPVSVGGKNKFDASDDHGTASALQRKPIAAGGEAAIQKRLHGSVSKPISPAGATASKGGSKAGSYPSGAKDRFGRKV